MRFAAVILLLLCGLVAQGCGFALEPFLRLDQVTLRATELDRSGFTFQSTETDSPDGWRRQIQNASAREARPEGVSDVSLIKVTAAGEAQGAPDINTALGSVSGRAPQMGSICGVDSQLRFRPGSGFFVWGAIEEGRGTSVGDLQMVGLAVLIYGLSDSEGAAKFSRLLLEVEVDGVPVIGCDPDQAEADVLAVLAS